MKKIIVIIIGKEPKKEAKTVHPGGTGNETEEMEKSQKGKKKESKDSEKKSSIRKTQNLT